MGCDSHLPNRPPPPAADAINAMSMTAAARAIAARAAPASLRRTGTPSRCSSSSKSPILLASLTSSSLPALINSARLLDRVWPLVPSSSSSSQHSPPSPCSHSLPSFSSSSDMNAEFMKRSGTSQRLFILHHAPDSAVALLQVALRRPSSCPPPISSLFCSSAQHAEATATHAFFYRLCQL